MFRGDVAHSGISQGQGVSAANRLRWKFEASGDGIASSPVVSDGIIHFASYGGHLYALDTDTGKQRWRFSLESTPYRSSAAVVDGVLYFCGGSWNLYALNPTTGYEIWRYKTRSWVENSPLVYRGKVHFASKDGHCYAVEAKSGREVWKFFTGDAYQYYITSPVGSGDLVYFGAGKTRGTSAIFALSASTGEPRWTHTVAKRNGTVHFSPLVLQERVLYFGDDNGTVSGLDALTGRKVWTYDAGAQVLAAPIISGGIAYLAQGNRQFRAVRMKDNVVVWTFTTREAHDSGISSPVMAGQKLYFGSSDGYLYCVSAKTGQKEWEFSARGMVQASPALVGDTIYFASRGRFLYAVQERRRSSVPNPERIGR